MQKVLCYNISNKKYEVVNRYPSALNLDSIFEFTEQNIDQRVFKITNYCLKYSKSLNKAKKYFNFKESELCQINPVVLEGYNATGVDSSELKIKNNFVFTLASTQEDK